MSITSTLRVMTYNVHGCVGTDARLDEGRIAEVIASFNPDVVALQELDVERARSGGIDQVRLLADHLKMDFQFHPTLSHFSEHYGDAILSKLPMSLVKKGILPTTSSRLAFEPRGALLVRLDVKGEEVFLLNTHLGLAWDERLAQTQALLGPEWMGEPAGQARFILCGDLNALPGSQVYRAFTRLLHDVQPWTLQRWPRATFPSRWPLARLDYIFINDRLVVEHVEVPSDKQIRTASDHLPLIADLALA
ncbi:endonuclease/exonuclease/phosphatase family metal-dependent hydrolase [Prosthecobacter fusiformis]|uniref:Endonuclease/exonuclease/phosphatase family metal-dependent hydrolase n=1 Tax=Prosthecobacter fusiformis TaxID=48464 RepID=A0A4R7S7X1_9BACT|nr:endonuclease/exonuclease/phosphatase family protein [Prosthecobacter fusiformis]TDU73347.1 endonuclease/exonuclease/phosphatase family metal-dependent hydrolase [Prosthecobacter fusiformis]